jgi:hypothetical protein
MSGDVSRARLPAPQAWDAAICAEFERDQLNGRVGSRLVSESGRVRVWSLRLAPGERIGFHRHVLDYFWTAVAPGRSRSRYADGRILETEYPEGATRHFSFGPGEFMVHDLTNIGETDLVFTTVEFLDSANPPLPLT